MKIMHKDLKLAAFVIFSLNILLVGILLAIIYFIYTLTSSVFPVSTFLYFGMTLVMVIFPTLWHFLHERFFEVTPSVLIAYDYDDGPWLNFGSNPRTTMVINWITKEDAPTVLQYKLASDPVDKFISVEFEVSKVHHVLLSGLTPDTEYTYQILDFVNDGIFHFKTAPDNLEMDKEIEFIVMGDTQNGGGLGVENWAYPRLVQTVLSNHKDLSFYLHVGDFCDQGNDLRSWHVTLNESQPLIGNIPFEATIGNHDGGTHFLSDPDAKFYPDEGANWDCIMGYEYHKGFDLKRFKYEDQITSFKGRYFSYYYGNAFFLLLDSKESKTAEPLNPQWVYIDEQLSKVPDGYWKIILIHRPLVYLGGNAQNGFHYEYGMFAPYILPLLDKHKVDMVIAGHGHYYLNMEWKFTKEVEFYNSGKKEKFDLVDYSKSPNAHPIRFIMTGGGGNELRKADGLTNDQVNLPGFVYRENSSQYLNVKIIKNELKTISIRADGSIMDELVLKKDP